MLVSAGAPGWAQWGWHWWPVPLPRRTSPPLQVTFTKDIAPIFQKACESCHRPDSIAPMSLVTYEEARPWARSIKARVAARQMPPWHIDKTVGIQHFKNDRSLSDEQIDTIVKWVDAGAPKGDLKDMPPPVKWPNEQRLELRRACSAEPRSDHQVARMHAAGRGAGRVVQAGRRHRPHRAALGPRHRNPSRHRQGPQDHPPRARPSAAGRDDARPDDATSADDDPAAGLFMEWAVGKQGEIMRPNTGKLLLPGSKHRAGTSTTTRSAKKSPTTSSSAVYFYPKGQEPKFRQTLALLERHPGRQPQPRHPAELADRRPRTSTCCARRAALENFQPHMHLRGKAMLLEAILPDGTVQMLSYGQRTSTSTG